MIEAAQAKAAAAAVANGADAAVPAGETGVGRNGSARFSVADASRPPVPEGLVDVVLARHVLWAFDSPADVLATWVSLLAPRGRLVLIEGRWSTGAGHTAGHCEALVREHREDVQVQMLDDPPLWGREITDERYLLISER